MKTPPTNHSRKEERIALRADTNTKVLLQQAADISGLPLEEFIVNTTVTRAQRVLSQTTTTRVSNDKFCRMLDAIENPPASTTIWLRHCGKQFGFQTDLQSAFPSSQLCHLALRR
jgi:uncharacterized protein (DUF1778 family)